MDKQMAEMFGNMVESISDNNFTKKCPNCKTDKYVVFDRHEGSFDCYSCMKKFY